MACPLISGLTCPSVQAAGDNDEWLAAYARLPAMMTRRPPQPPPEGSSTRTAGAGGGVNPGVALGGGGMQESAVFRGNDDASLEGSMDLPIRFGMHSQWLLLVGGRDLYEAAVPGGAEVVVGERIPTGHTGPGAADAIAAAPLHDLFRRAFWPSAEVNAGAMASEEGFFLRALLSYEMVAAHAAKSRLLSGVARPVGG